MDFWPEEGPSNTSNLPINQQSPAGDSLESIQELVRMPLRAKPNPELLPQNPEDTGSGNFDAVSVSHNVR